MVGGLGGRVSGCRSCFSFFVSFVSFCVFFVLFCFIFYSSRIFVFLCFVLYLVCFLCFPLCIFFCVAAVLLSASWSFFYLHVSCFVLVLPYLLSLSFTFLNTFFVAVFFLLHIPCRYRRRRWRWDVFSLCSTTLPLRFSWQPRGARGTWRSGTPTRTRPYRPGKVVPALRPLCKHTTNAHT